MKEFCENTVLEGEHVILRPLQLQDKNAVFRNINHDREVLNYFIDTYAEKEEDFAFENMMERFSKNQMYAFAIVLKETGETIGEIFQCSKPSSIEHTTEIGYAIGRSYWNRGYTTEAMKLMIDFMFEVGIHKVVACHLEGNEASGKVMQKCGMIYEGMRKDAVFYRDHYWDTYNYYILCK
ncbi:MAG: GNAT family N-acetyltransferase [Erysipelotrichaceae bacterium]|nr:GNAT family N-acetyltransferase [Erysipelotrichaceae bacterium]